MSVVVSCGELRRECDGLLLSADGFLYALLPAGRREPLLPSSLLDTDDETLKAVEIELSKPLALRYLLAGWPETSMSVDGGLRLERDEKGVQLRTLGRTRTRFAFLGPDGWGRLQPGRGEVQLVSRRLGLSLLPPVPLGPRQRLSALAERLVLA